MDFEGSFLGSPNQLSVDFMMASVSIFSSSSKDLPRLHIPLVSRPTALGVKKNHYILALDLGQNVLYGVLKYKYYAKWRQVGHLRPSRRPKIGH